jgi:hypothetical protein
MKHYAEVLVVAVLGILAASTYAQPTVPVIVTNPATSPIMTMEAYPRTPVHLVFCHGFDAADCSFTSYVVPTDKILVVETMLASIECKNATQDTNYNAALSEFPSVPNTYFLPVQRQGSSGPGTARYVGAQNFRVWFAPGKQIQGAATCDSGSYDGIFHVFGYLVSPNNPSLAP